jgi:hypothetical protein
VTTRALQRIRAFPNSKNREHPWLTESVSFFKVSAAMYERFPFYPETDPFRDFFALRRLPVC